MLIGVIAMVVGYATDTSDHHNRFWANIFVNGFFYFAISLGALFFLALQYATEASYMIALKRVIEGISQYIFVGSGILCCRYFPFAPCVSLDGYFSHV